MVKYYYKKKEKFNLRKYLHILSLLFLAAGIVTIAYVLLPLILWYIYFQPVFSVQNIVNPIPKANMISSSNTETSPSNLSPVFDKKNESNISKYVISIPRLNIENAVVSTVDTNTAKHLVNYGKDNVPGKVGNALIFGHSTLPQFFNAKNYKTIFANIYKLRNGDKIYATVGNSIYSYKVFKSIVVKPSDTSILEQDYTNSYITLVTCTPPGTLWKRLIVKARFEKII